MSPVEEVWRREASVVLAALLRRHGDLGDCEDAVAEATEAALVQWPVTGTPRDPRAWLVRVASRRLVDRVRAEAARSNREHRVAHDRTGGGDHADHVTGDRDADDVLQMLFLCCHPSLTRRSQVALTLRSVAGLSVEQIAAAHLVPARTMTQRLTRARVTLRHAGARFSLPAARELPERVAAVLDTCYLMFNEGYACTSGDALLDDELSGEAVRLTRLIVRALPDHAEAAGLLALMLLTRARSAARVDAYGDLIPLAEQDRRQWDPRLVAEGTALVEATLRRGHLGPYQVQAAIAALHAEATSYARTDWLQISLLYAVLHDVAPSPMVTLNRSVAVGMAYGPEKGLALLDPLGADPAMARHHRWHAVRAHLLEMAQDPGAADAYRRAAALTRSRPEQRYLNARLRGLVAEG